MYLLQATSIDPTVGLIAIGIFLLLFLAFRQIVLWYFRISAHIENQENIIKRLNTIIDLMVSDKDKERRGLY